MSAKTVKPKTKVQQFLDTRYARLVILLCVILVAGAIVLLHGHKNQKMYPYKSACKLFTLSDATKMLGSGTTVTSSPENNINTGGLAAKGSSCSYRHSDYQGGQQSSADYDRGVTKQLSINITGGFTNKTLNQMQTGFDKAKSLAPNEVAVKLGDDAFYVPSSGSLSIFFANYAIGINYFESLNNPRHERHDKTVNLRVADQILAKIVK